MCDPITITLVSLLAVTASTAVAGVGVTAAQAEAQRRAIEKSGKKTREGIIRQQEFNRGVSLAKAVEARDRAAIAAVDTSIAGARARAKVRVAGLTGGSALRVEGEAARRTGRTRQLLGLNLRGAEQQIRFEIEGGQISAENQLLSIPTGSGGGLAVAAASLRGIGQVASAATSSGLLGGLQLDVDDPGIVLDPDLNLDFLQA